MTRTALALADGDEPADVLAALRRLHAERAELERHEASLVRRARNEGIVWEQIATCLGVTRQAVHKKHAARTGPAVLSRRGRG